MFEVLLLIASLIMILIAWGFWPFVGVLVAFVACVLIFKQDYGPNWGGAIAMVAIIVLGIAAVNSHWHEPAYTAAAIVITVIFFALEFK